MCQLMPSYICTPSIVFCFVDEILIKLPNSFHVLKYECIVLAHLSFDTCSNYYLSEK